MKVLFQNQFRYNQWANEKLLAFCASNKVNNNRINPIFSHLTLAQVLWCDRLNGKPTPPETNEWTTWPWDEIVEKCNETNSLLIEYVDAHVDDEFNEEIDFINTSGTANIRKVRDVLTHVSQYTNFDRGQIVGLIHQGENIITPSLDYIDYLNS